MFKNVQKHSKTFFLRKLQLRKIPLPIKDEVNLFLAYVMIIRSKPCTVNVRNPNVPFGKPNKKWFGFQHIPISDVRFFFKVAIPLGWILSIFCNKTHISMDIK